MATTPTPQPTLPIILVDLRDREQHIRSELQKRVFELETQKKRDGTLDPTLQKELDDDKKRLQSADIIDPLFKAVQTDFSKTNQPVDDHDRGALPSQQGNPPRPDFTADEKALAATFGILEREAQTDPAIGRRFFQALAAARGEVNAYPDLYNSVLSTLIKDADPVVRPVLDPLTYEPTKDENGNIITQTVLEVDGSQWAAVIKALLTQGVKAGDKHLGVKTTFALASQEGVNDNAPPSSIAIDLPDLDAQTNVEIIVDNLIACQGLHFAAMFEEVNGFKVTDTLVNSFSLGQLPFGRGNAGDGLYSYWKKSVNRLTEVERRNLYARTFGMPGGDPSAGKPNAEFSDLWMRFVSAVSSFSRQLSVDDLIRARVPGVVNQEGVKKAARDLAGNLSLHGYGIAYFAATELQTQIKDIIALLSDDEVKGAYGAKDMWGVIDSISTLELGMSRNTVKYRTMATAGATIMKWLADHANDLTSSSTFTILSREVISTPPIRAAGSKVTTNPTDRDLVDACESWLAVTGTPDERVEQYSQPVEPPMYTSAPIRMPQVAQDLLDSVGVKPMSYVNGKAKSATAGSRG